MKKRLLIALFIIAALLQFAIPLSMICKYEKVLRKGEVFRFETAPVDPHDPFRGKYVTLNIKNDMVNNPGGLFKYGDEVFLTVANREDGFAYFSKASKERPETSNYYKTYCEWEDIQGIHVKINFDRYYMNEDKAPAAERRYNNAVRDSKNKSWVLVRIMDGTAVIEDLFINGIPARELFINSD